jgi:hypothetical protein
VNLTYESVSREKEKYELTRKIQKCEENLEYNSLQRRAEKEEIETVKAKMVTTMLHCDRKIAQQ